MKVVEAGRERLIIVAGDSAFAWVLLVLGIGMATWAGILTWQRPRALASEPVLGAVLGAVLFAGAFLALYERSRFVFDRTSRTLVWQRRRAFGTRCGRVAFDGIRAVLAQATTSGKGSTQPKWRLALSTGAEILPVSVAYAPDADARVLHLAERVRRFIGLPVTDAFIGRVLHALRSGRRDEALRLLQEERHVAAAAAERFLAVLSDAGR